MSAEATGWVFRHSPYSGTAFAVHLAIADTVNDQHGHRFYMSAGNLARKARCSRSTATELLGHLCRDGFLARIGGGRDDGKPVEYRFLYPEVAAVFDTRGGVPKTDTPTTSEVSREPTPDVPGADTGCPGSGQEVSREPTQTQENPTEPKRSRRKRRTPPPEDFAPTDAHRELAISLRLDIDAERREFIDGAHAHGRIYADHDRAFTQWLRRAPTFGPAKALLDLEPPGGPTFAGVEQHGRDVGPYACPLELGCDNGWHDGPNGAVRCSCLSRATA